ncbi:MAG: hypothetical protein QOC81_124 [Thermoanaerobaculia bacterium]|jgi:hypothetical protein|nr:hypothetical protein [Thermoanaerobaculia bacterium]
MQDVTFHNVTITINATDGASAYTALCDALGPLESEWVTDTYTIYDEEGHEVEAGSTDALWPKED